MPTTPSLHDLLVQAERLIADGQPAAAQSLVQDAYKLDRTNPDVLVLVAQVSTAPDVQRNALHKALAANPNHPKARELLARMQTSGSAAMPGMLPPATPSSARQVPTPASISSKRGLPLVPLLISGIVVVLALVGGALALSGARTPATTIAQAPTLVPTTRLPATAPIQNTAIPATQGAVASVVTTAPTMTPLPLVASPTVSIPAPAGNAIELTATALNQQIATTLVAATERARPTQLSAQQSTLVAQVGATQTALAAGSLITGTIYVNADGSAVVPNPQVVMLNMTYNGQRRRPSVSPDGKSILFVSVAGDFKSSDIVVANSDGSRLKAVVTDTPELYTLSWSPDSAQIALASIGYATGRGDMLVVGLDGSPMRSVVEPPYLTRSSEAAWSPDSKRIAMFALPKSGERDVVLIVSDVASAKTIRLTTNAFQPLKLDYPYWSPDGKWIAYRVSPGTGIHLVSSDGAMQRVLPLSDLNDTENSINSDRSFAWSPDSRQVAFLAITKNNESSGVVIQSIADGKSVFYPNTGYANLMGLKGFGFWSPDGQFFAALSRGNVVFLRADGGEPRRVALPTADNYAHSIGVWSPNSKFVVVSFAINQKARTVFVPVEGGTPLPFDVGGTVEAWLP